jgi:pimeloyl-ACP methyl ester carboxylesterase
MIARTLFNPFQLPGRVGQERPILPAGRRQALKRDIPEADVRFLDTGHFALETHAKEIADVIEDFLAP